MNNLPETLTHAISDPVRERSLAPIRRMLEQAETVLSIAHPFSDGDALGSQLAMHHFCLSQGKRSFCLNFDPIPDPLQWMPGAKDLVSGVPDGEKYDLAFLMETTDAARMGDRLSLLDSAKNRIHIDHHSGIAGLGDLNYIDPSASSTCEILYDLLLPWRSRLPRETLESLYVGIMTDTGNFRFSNSTKRAHEIAGEIIFSGIDISRIYKQVYESNPYRKIIIHGLAMSRAQRCCNDKIIYSWLDWEDFVRLGAGPVDADGAINQLCTVVGVELAVTFREQPDGRVKVSLRSNGRVDVQKVSKFFGGGGHKAAAGADIPGSITSVRNMILEMVEPLVTKLEN